MSNVPKTTKCSLGVLVTAATLWSGSLGLPTTTYARTLDKQIDRTASQVISFDANGGSGAMNPITVATGSVTLPPVAFTREGYRFIGWSTIKDDSSVSVIDGGQWAGSGTLYAIWAPQDQVVEIQFDANGGYGVMQSIYVRKDSGSRQISLPYTRFARDNYSFRGYARSANNTVSPIPEGGTLTLNSDDLSQGVTLYAIWNKVNTNLGGALPQFANQTVMMRGVATPPKDLPESWGWDVSYGWYDINQDSSNTCWAASGSNAIQWWLNNNREYVERFATLQKALNPSYEAPYLDDMKMTNADSKLDTKTPGYHNNVRKSSIYHAVIADFPDNGNAMNTAARWYITGGVGKNPKGYFKDVVKELIETSEKFNRATLAQNFQKAIEEGAIMIVNNPGHAFTMWGAHFDEDGYIDRAYFTNSQTPDPGGMYEMNIYYKDGCVWFGKSDTDKTLTKLVSTTLIKLDQNDWEQYFRTHQTPQQEKVASASPTGIATVEVNNYSELNQALKNSDNAAIILQADIQLTSNQQLAIERSVSLDFNNHTISRAASDHQTVMAVTSDNQINVVLKNGTITGGNAGVSGTGGLDIKASHAHVALNHMTITGNAGVQGGGLRVAGGAQVSMTGGTISNNRAIQQRAGKGGGVYVEDGTFTLVSGSITQNTADFNGGGVSVSATGSFVMEGGSISDNTVSASSPYGLDQGGAGIGTYSAGSILTLKGGSITGNHAQGAYAAAGGVLSNGALVTIGGNVKITGNTAESTTFSKPDSNLIIKGQSESSGVRLDNPQDAQVGIQLSGDATGRFTAGSAQTQTDVYPQIFTSDNPYYQVTAEGTLQPKGQTAFVTLDAQSGTSGVYGDSTTLAVQIKSNGIIQHTGTLTAQFPNGTTQTFTSKSDYAYTLGFSPASEDLGLNVGNNTIKLTWSYNEQTYTKDITYVLSPYTLESDSLTWSGATNRSAGDGKSVTAHIAIQGGVGDAARHNGLLPADAGKVHVAVDGGNAQTAGTHTAQAVSLYGERAQYYQLEVNSQPREWQKEYKLAGDELALDITPAETNAQPGDKLSFDVFVKQGSSPVSGGNISIAALDGHIRSVRDTSTTEVSDQGFASIGYTVPTDAQDGPLNLTITYTSKTGKQSTAPVSVRINSSLETLTFSGELSAEATYGASYNDLPIVATKNPTNEKGEEVEGSWRWRVDDNATLPGASDNSMETVVFVPKRNAGAYRELVSKVDPKITKAPSPSVPGFYDGHAQVTATTVLLPKMADNNLSGAPAEYAISEIGNKVISTDTSKLKWQTSPLFTGLEPGVRYTFIARFAETDNYLASKTNLPFSWNVTLTTSANTHQAYVSQTPTATATYGTKGSNITLQGGEVKCDSSVVQGSWSWQNAPSDYLEVGNTEAFYAQFTSSDGKTKLSAPVVPTITKKKLDTPVATTIAAVGTSSVTVNALAAQAGIDAQYGISSSADGSGATWQASPRFDGLQAQTSYWFATRYPGNKNYEQSEHTTWVCATTESLPTPPVVETPTITVTSHAQSVTYGQNLMVTATAAHIKSHSQVALIVNGTTIATQSINADGSVTLTYNTADKKLDVGKHSDVTIKLTSGDTTVQTEVPEISLRPLTAQLSWNNTEGRVAGDGKTVTASVSNLLASDQVAVKLNEAASDATAGTKTVTATQLTGYDATWYQLPAHKSVEFTVAAHQANVAPTWPSSPVTYGDTIRIPVTVTSSANGSSSAPPTGSVSLCLGDTILDTQQLSSDGHATLQYNTAEHKLSIGSNTLTVTYAGSNSYAPAKSAQTSIELHAKKLSVSQNSLQARQRAYDGTTRVEIEGTPQLQGNIATDNVRLAGTPIGTLDSADAGTNKPVIVSGLSLEGDDASCYELIHPTLTVTIDTAEPKVVVDAPLSAQEGSTFGALKAQLPTTAVGVGDERVRGNFTWSFNNKALGDDDVLTPSMKELAYTFTPDAHQTNYSAQTLKGTVELVIAALPAPTITITSGEQNVAYGSELKINVAVSHIPAASTASIALYQHGERIAEPVRISEDGNTTLVYDTTTKKLNIGTHRDNLTACLTTSKGEVIARVPAVTVSPRMVDILWSNTQDRYAQDGKTVSASVSGVLQSDNVSLVLSDQAHDDSAGAKTVTAELTGADHGWYAINNSSKSVSFTIDRQVSAMQVSGNTRVTYGDSFSWQLKLSKDTLKRRSEAACVEDSAQTANLAAQMGSGEPAQKQAVSNLPAPTGTIQLTDAQGNALTEHLPVEQGMVSVVLNTQTKRLNPGNTTLKMVYSGDSVYAPTTMPIEITLDRKPLIVQGITAISRAYNGTAVVDLNTSKASVDGILPQDQSLVSITWPLQATVENIHTGSHKRVTIPAPTLTGSASQWYAPSAYTTDVSITPIAAKAEPFALSLYANTPLLSVNPQGIRTVFGDWIPGTFSYTFQGAPIDPATFMCDTPGTYTLGYTFVPSNPGSDYLSEPINGTLTLLVSKHPASSEHTPAPSLDSQQSAKTHTSSPSAQHEQKTAQDDSSKASAAIQQQTSEQESSSEQQEPTSHTLSSKERLTADDASQSKDTQASRPSIALQPLFVGITALVAAIIAAVAWVYKRPKK